MKGGFGSSPLEIMACNAMLTGEIYCQFFSYSAVFQSTTALGATSTVDVPVPINADSDFILQELNLSSFTAADTPEVDPDYLLMLTVAGSGRQLMDRAQTVQNLCGSFLINKAGGNQLPFPVLIQANNTLTVTLTNRSAVAANRVDVSLIGFKVYYIGEPETANRRAIFHVL
jgi:hypothetical protein